METLDIKQIRQHLKLTQTEFARKIGMSISAIQKWEAGGKIPAAKVDLIKGMIENTLEHNNPNDEIEEPESLDVRVYTRKVKRNLIPYYDAETTGGNVGAVSSSNEPVSLKGYVDPGDWFYGTATAAIRHVGDSMIEYPSGCILIVKQVNNIHLLVPGKNYVIETSEYRITKKVQFGKEKGTLRLHSTNREKYDDGTLIHQPFTLELEDVRRIYSILGYLVSLDGESHFIKVR